MNTRTLTVVLASLAVIGVSVVYAAPNNDTVGFRQVQVDGICSAVVDNLWQADDAWWHAGEYHRIIKLDRIMTEADPHFLLPYSDGGWLMESLGNYSDAEKYYRLGTVRNPSKCFAWYTLGCFYFMTEKNYPDAIKTFQSATQTPDNFINVWKMLAHSFERNNQYPQALLVWQVLQKKYPTDAVVQHNLIEVQQKVVAAQATPMVQ